MEVTEALRELVIGNVPVSELRIQAMKDGMLTLRQSGLVKVAEGATTLEEVCRETM